MDSVRQSAIVRKRLRPRLHRTRQAVPRLRLLLVGLLCVAISACADQPVGPDDDGYEPGPPLDHPPPAPSISGFLPLSLATFDGSGQVVHPDWAFTPMDWFPQRQHLAITPYPEGNAAFELPSEYTSNDGVTWVTPAGGSNPLVPQPYVGYLSDPDQLYTPDAGELWLYYRPVDSLNRVSLLRSRNGSVWTSPREVLTGPNHTIISPAIVRLN